MTIRTVKNLCPNLQKPPLPSKIPGYASGKKDIHRMGDCNWNCELNRYLQISVKYIVYAQFMAASALLKYTLFIEECMAATTFVT